MMRKALKDKLTALGVTLSDYVVTHDGEVFTKETQGDRVIAPAIWGLTLEHDRHGKMHIEHQADQYGGNARWYIRTRQGDGQTTIGPPHRRQQDAIAAVLKRWMS